MIKWNQLNIIQKGIVEQIITYTSIFLLSLICLGVTAYNKSKYYNMNAAMSRVQQIASSKKYNHEQKIQKETLSGKNTNADPILTSILQNRYFNEVPLKDIKQFFTITHTYSSKNMYEARFHKLQKWSTPNVIKNKALFSSKYNNMNSVISDISSTEMSHGNNNDNLLVECHTTTWMPANSSNDDSESDKHSFGRWYKVTYNTQQKKIINVQPIYMSNNSDNNDFDTTSTTQSGSGVYY